MDRRKQAHSTKAGSSTHASTDDNPGSSGKKKKTRREAETSNQKRRCISTACIACRKRKSKCDGALPSCAACASVYGTECIYDPNSDHRRKGVYRDKIDSTKAKETTLQVLVDAILSASDDSVSSVVNSIRSCDNLDVLAQQMQNSGFGAEDEDRKTFDQASSPTPPEGERELAGKMGELRLENGSLRYIGGTSHLIYLGDPGLETHEADAPQDGAAMIVPITSWTRVSSDIQLITHLINMYFAYHYAYFTTLSRSLFWRDFLQGRTDHCSSLLVNSMLSLGCHFTDLPGAFAVQGDRRTKGDHFFAEAKRLIMENDAFEKPHIVTVQALALMSVREAGCGREAKGWVYSGMSFRMAQDLGLNFEISAAEKECMSDEEIDARRITFWGCFLFDKCWSNYLGRLPQLPQSSMNVPKFDVFPDEEASLWMPLTDKGFDESLRQPARTRSAALLLAHLCEISSDLLLFFYHPNHISQSSSKAAELKRLGDLHQRLEEWHRTLPREFEARDGQLPNVILMHMFFHLQYIHLFRPFLKYNPTSSPLPSHVSPRRICTANAGAISKLMRLYKKNWNLRQICNIAVYMVHSACTIHLLNLPEKTAKRDFTHGIKHLEEIAKDWLCARRTLTILSVLARKWNCEIPEEAAVALSRADDKYGSYNTSDVPSPKSSLGSIAPTVESEHNSPRGHFLVSQLPPATHPSSIAARLGLDQGSAQGVLNVNQHSFPETLPSLSEPTPIGRFSPDDFNLWNQALTTPISYNEVAPIGSLSQNLAQSPLTTAPPTPIPQNGMKVMLAKDTGLESSQWFLTDSAKWQRNFEGWDSSYGLPTSAAPGPGENQMRPAEREAAKRAQGANESEQFDPSLSCGGWLPGLD